ncbi:hypothetical protein F5H01DRAFT_384146 [Linnemannia elongata]|nr:hypothetical protein F5H01DRAFT_384146 [Linnemannia elongata]
MTQWLENEKGVTPEGEEESVTDLEPRLPPLRGQSGTVVNYLEKLQLVETRLRSAMLGMTIVTRIIHGTWSEPSKPPGPCREVAACDLRKAQAPATACSSWIITMDGEFQYEFKQHGSKRYHGNKQYSDEQHHGG